MSMADQMTKEKKPLTLAEVVGLLQANFNQKNSLLDTIKKLDAESAALIQILINQIGGKPPSRAERRRLEKLAKSKK